MAHNFFAGTETLKIIPLETESGLLVLKENRKNERDYVRRLQLHALEEVNTDTDCRDGDCHEEHVHGG